MYLWYGLEMGLFLHVRLTKCMLHVHACKMYLGTYIGAVLGTYIRRCSMHILWEGWLFIVVLRFRYENNDSHIYINFPMLSLAVASTSLSQQTAPSHTSPHQPVPSQPSPRQPAPSQPSPRQPAPSQPTARQPAPSQSIPRQPTPSQPLPRQPQAPSVENVPRSTAQTSQRKEPDPTKPEPSTQWPEFTNVWESSERYRD